jgi:predicted phosphodiesterase
MKNFKIGFIGDIHSNSLALKECLSIMKEKNVSKFIFMGDLLTYGPDPQETIDIILKHRNSSVFILGNHDKTYLDLLTHSTSSYFDSLSPWIKESFNWTINNISTKDFQKIPFCSDFIFENIYISHANPYSPSSWDYINTLQDHQNARNALLNNNFKIGIFGHTHRPKIYNYKENLLNEVNSSKSFQLEEGVINTGSIGQPRGINKIFGLILSPNDKIRDFEFFEIPISFKDVAEKILTTNLSLDTKIKINKFYI